MKDIIIIDNSPMAYLFNQENALPILSWYEDPKDQELRKMTPILERLAEVDDVRNYIKYMVFENKILMNKAHAML